MSNTELIERLRGLTTRICPQATVLVERTDLLAICDALEEAEDRLTTEPASGAEAEELRAGLEQICKQSNGSCHVCGCDISSDDVQHLLDKVDARDSLAHLETVDRLTKERDEALFRLRLASSFVVEHKAGEVKYRYKVKKWDDVWVVSRQKSISSFDSDLVFWSDERKYLDRHGKWEATKKNAFIFHDPEVALDAVKDTMKEQP